MSSRNATARTIPNVNRGSISGAVILWVFALFWNGFLLVMVLAARSANQGPPPTTLYALVSPFALAGLFLLGLAINVTATLIRYRSLVLHLDTLPGVVGGKLSGTIHGAEGVLNEGMSLRLACWRRYRSSKRSDDLLWEDVEDIPRGSMYRSPVGATVPFRFDVPWECEPTADDDPRIGWQLTIRTRGGGEAGSFDVPVHRTEQSSPDVNEKSLRPRNVAQPPYSKLRFQREPDGSVEIRFPTPTWVWKWYVFTIVIAAAALIVAREKIPAMVAEGMPRVWVIGTYVAIGAVVLFLLAIIQLGLFFSPRLLHSKRDALRMRFRSFLRGPKVVPASGVADIVIDFSNSARKYNVGIQKAGGAIDPWLMITAVDKREAEWLAHELRGALLRAG